MQHLQHNTAATVVLGPMVDWRDGKTLITDTPSVSDLTCTLYKNGTGSAKTLAGNLTVDTNGMALLTLSAGDTDTVGRLDIVLANAVDGDWTTEIIVPRSGALTVLSAAGVAALHNGPDIPTTGQIRSELAAELAQITALADRLTAARAALLDHLDVPGTLAQASDVADLASALADVATVSDITLLQTAIDSIPTAPSRISAG